MKKRKQSLGSQLISDINKYSRSDHCLLCGRKISSACNSHVVPKFILREIAEKGMVSYGFSLDKKDIDGVRKTTGINNAYTFRLICDKCDREHFKHYENPNYLTNFSSLNENDRKLILCEMAIKAHLAHIQMKYETLVMFDIVSGGEISTLEENGVLLPRRIDILEHMEYIDKIKKYKKSNKNPFVVLFEKTLDYKVKLTTQTIINFIYDLDGNKIFDPNDLSKDNHCRYFYLMILPYKDKTYVLFYIEKNKIDLVKEIADAFEAMSEKEKLHFLFISLVIHDQQFYMSPSFASFIAKKDKKLSRLYHNTDKDSNYLIEIKNFRLYKNYLLKEFNDEQEG